VFGIILFNYVLEFLYVLARLLGLQLWLAPIDLSTVDGQISQGLYVFELIFTGQLFFVWIVSWRKKWVLHVQRNWQVSIVAVLGILLAIVVVLVFTWDPTWPGMLYRRLFAYSSKN